MWLGLCELRVMNDRRWPWLVLVPQRPGIEEIHDLTPLDQAMLTFETNMVAQALKKVTGCTKINSAALGNIVRQLHVHVVARSEGDPGWPGPVWGHGMREPYRRSTTSTGLPNRSRRRYKRSRPSHLTLSHAMTFRLFDAPLREPSQFVGFAGNMIDRQSENRSDDSVEQALADRSARLMLMRGGRILLKLRDGGFDAYFTSGREPAPSAPASTRRCCSASSAQGPVLAVPVGDRRRDLAGRRSRRSTTGRSICRACSTPTTLGALAQGAALLAWHASHRFCSKCGSQSEMRAGGYKRHLPGLRHRAFSAHRSGGDHADGDPRAMPARPQPAFRAGHVFGARRLHRAGRDDRERGAARNLGGSRHPARPRRLPRQPALAVPLFADDRLFRRGAERGHPAPTAPSWKTAAGFPATRCAPCCQATRRSGIFVPPKAAIAHHLIRAWAESD